MTTFDAYTGESVWQDEEWYYLQEEAWEDGFDGNATAWVMDRPRPLPLPLTPELVLFTAVGVILLMALMLVMRQPLVAHAPLVPPGSTTQTEEQAEPLPFDPASFTNIYDDYIITQGPHGTSYGHYAIDIAAGAGAAIKSPIFGTVTQIYTDEWGNPTLVIENDVYAVMYLHGVYNVTVGQEVAQGDVIGTESNIGNTYDMAGNSCRGRNCGYHTHLNVYDKRLGSNVNPLDLLQGG